MDFGLLLVITTLCIAAQARNEVVDPYNFQWPMAGWLPKSLGKPYPFPTPSPPPGPVSSYIIGFRDSRRNSWMRNVPDHTLLSRLSIPGTYDSLNYGFYSPIQTRHQNYGVLHQLLYGIRYLDITLRYNDGWLYVSPKDIFASGKAAKLERLSDPEWPRYHDGDENFIQLLVEWLRINEDECLIIRFRPDPRQLGVNATDFARAFERNMSPFEGTLLGSILRDRLYVVHDTGITEIPKLSDVRGKILLLLDFEGAEAMHEFGIPWRSSTLLKRDKWEPEVRTTASVERKWLAIDKHLDKAALSKSVNNLYITNVASTGNSTSIIPPEIVAAGGSRALSDSGVRVHLEYKKYQKPGLWRKIKNLFRSANERGTHHVSPEPRVLATTNIRFNPRQGARDNRAKEPAALVGMNDRTMRKLMKDWKKSPTSRAAGIVVLDFPGNDLVQSIINLN